MTRIILLLVSIIVLNLPAQDQLSDPEQKADVDQKTEVQDSPLYEVTANALNIRSGMSTGSAVVGKLQKGDQIEVLETHDSWLQIRSGNITGYVSANFVKPVPKSPEFFGVKLESAGKYIQEKLPYSSWKTWAIVVGLFVLLVFIFMFFGYIDVFLNRLRRRYDKEPGFAWPLIVMAVLAVALVVGAIWSGKETEWFFGEGFSLLPNYSKAVHWFLYGFTMLGILAAVGLVVESFLRVGPVLALPRIAIVSILSIYAFFVTLYVAIGLIFLALIIIALWFGLTMLRTMGMQKYRDQYGNTWYE